MKLVVVGSANTDMVVKTKKMPIPGETVLGGDFCMNQGGKGANQAVCARKLGMDVGFYARLGRDIFGENALKYYKELGIDTQKIELIPTSPSGVALITVDEKGENSIVVASGANSAVLPLDVEYAKDYINEFDGLLVQFEIPLKSVTTAIEVAYQRGKFIVVNPAPAKEINDRYFKMMDVLIPNRGEARQLLGMAPDDDSKTPEELAHLLRDKGAKAVVITLGTEGSFVSSQEGDFHVDCVKVNVVDTTGAGDAYCAALTCGCLWGKTLKEACEFASLVSALKVTKMGAQSSPTMEEVEKAGL
ncbi:MAG: ribokinase [Abditibacteriota bacterium]|nr:ribokinase [Abditibacteriota bacterium]